MLGERPIKRRLSEHDVIVGLFWKMWNECHIWIQVSSTNNIVQKFSFYYIMIPWHRLPKLSIFRRVTTGARQFSPMVMSLTSRRGYPEQNAVSPRLGLGGTAWNILKLYLTFQICRYTSHDAEWLNKNSDVNMHHSIGECGALTPHPEITYLWIFATFHLQSDTHLNNLKIMWIKLISGALKWTQVQQLKGTLMSRRFRRGRLFTHRRVLPRPTRRWRGMSHRAPGRLTPFPGTAPPRWWRRLRWSPHWVPAYPPPLPRFGKEAASRTTRVYISLVWSRDISQ